MRSTSTLRFRERNELERDLNRYGFNVLDLRDAPDRPGKKMVFLKLPPKRGGIDYKESHAREAEEVRC